MDVKNRKTALTSSAVGLSPMRNNKYYWVYFAGFFLILAQILNIFFVWALPIDWGKAISFRMITAVMAFLFLWQIASRQISLLEIKSKIKSVRWLLLLLLALVLVYSLATIFSIDRQFSLWGDPNRNGGFVNFAFYVIFAALAFLIIKKEDWRKLFDFLIVLSIAVCVIAIFQKFGIFSNFFIPYQDRPISVMGNALLLALYLVLVSFLSLFLGLTAKNRWRKIFYFSSFLLFIFVNVVLVQTRGAFLGLAAGALWFLFSYPNFKSRKTKIYIALALALIITGAYLSKVYLDSHLYVYEKIPLLIRDPIDRALSVFEGTKISEARTSVWKISLNAVKERPLLGWGPENFIVSFDRYYDPSLPKIGQIAPGDSLIEWFDRAHNFILEISVNAGIPALFIYVSFFGLLFWRLQKIKKAGPEIGIIATGLQAAFIGYLVSLLSSFDSFSTYLVSFFFVAYSLHLISTYVPVPQTESKPANDQKLKVFSDKLHRCRTPIILILLVCLIWFLWFYNLKPLGLNKKMTLALAYSDIEKEAACEKALKIMDEISPQISSSIINNYLGQRITHIIYGCVGKAKSRGTEEFVNQAIAILKKNTEQHPHLVTNWISIGEYLDILIKEKNRLTENIFVKTEENEKLKGQADYYFQKALELSPKRQLILKDWADTDTSTGDYQKAEEKLQKCINLNSSYARCYWYMALNKGYQKDYKGFDEFYKMAEERHYNVNTPASLQEIINMYIRNSDYKGLSEVYPKLIPVVVDPLEKAQLHASLAAAYKELGDIKKAREEVLKIKDLIPLLPKNLQEAALNDVNNFLEILK